MEPYRIAGTGSRSLILADQKTQEAVQLVIIDLLTRAQAFCEKTGKTLEVISGMAEGFDELLARTAIKLNIPLLAYIPNLGYGPYYWGRASFTKTNRYVEFTDLVSRAKAVRYSADSVYVEGRHSNFIRNEDMLRDCNYLLVYNPTSPGTAQCLAAAIKLGRISGRDYYEIKVPNKGC